MVDRSSYKDNFYPPFVSGSTMFFTPDVMKLLVDIFPKEEYFRLDDVYIALLIKKLRINATATPEHLWVVSEVREKKHECNSYPNAIIRHMYHMDDEKCWCYYKLYNEASNATKFL